MFVLKNPDRASSNESEPGLNGPDHEVVEGDGVEVVVTFGVGKIGIQYRLAQAFWATDLTATSGRCEVLVIESIVPGGLAAMCTAPHLQPGDILTKVNGEGVKGQRCAGLPLFASSVLISKLSSLSLILAELACSLACTGVSVHSHDQIMRWMREAPRPLKLTFETPLSPAARMTAVIKARTAAALEAATALAAAAAEEVVVEEGAETEGIACTAYPDIYICCL